jgi:hypothetical protein
MTSFSQVLAAYLISLILVLLLFLFLPLNFIKNNVIYIGLFLGSAMLIADWILKNRNKQKP